MSTNDQHPTPKPRTKEEFNKALKTLLLNVADDEKFQETLKTEFGGKLEFREKEKVYAQNDDRMNEFIEDYANTKLLMAKMGLPYDMGAEARGETVVVTIAIPLVSTKVEQMFKAISKADEIAILPTTSEEIVITLDYRNVYRML